MPPVPRCSSRPCRWARPRAAALAQTAGTRDAFVLGGCVALVAVLCAPFVTRLRQDDEG
ncbi:hypothetical protein [Saccharopolyspora cebuensis]|uniref:MFS transporter n=1 Tax=Saccharopolyspora cebuensis TaxID=418759 RepID=A0ABV4CD79_9PSEU